MEQKKYDLAVIGAGASGLFAVIAAGETKKDMSILILESQKKPGKRILATGNGRCNLSNRNVSPAHYHGNTEKIASLLDRFSPQTIEGLFRKMGLLCRESEEGRLYPYSLQANSVLSVLLHHVDRIKADLLCEKQVTDVNGKKGNFCISCGKEEFYAEQVVFASGGLSYSSLGGNSSGWEILTSLGHSLVPAFPSLVQLTVPRKMVSPLKGVRSKGIVSLYLDGKNAASSEGEIQFTEIGLSGICVFELSRIYGEYAVKGGKSAELSCDLMPEFSVKDISQILRERTKNVNFPVNQLLEGILPKALAQEIIRRAVQNFTENCGNISGKDIAAVAKMVKDFRFPITGTAGWESAQVTAGGVPLSEINLQTMESRKCPGVYLAGELLNIDGDCGGYNLHWAWSTGYLAGSSAAISWRNIHGSI